jgi:regulatory protein
MSLRPRRTPPAPDDDSAPPDPGPSLAPTAEERAQHALELAYKALNRRDRTVAEIRWHLTGRGCDPDAIEGALAALAEQGYVDDERYAQRGAEDRRSLDGWGRERIARRLEEAGVPCATIDAALADRTADDELDAALAVLRGRFRTPPADDRDRDRALGLLVRRGYELELAYDAIRAFERDGAA